MKIGRLEYNTIIAWFVSSDYPESELRARANQYFDDNPDFFDKIIALINIEKNKRLKELNELMLTNPESDYEEFKESIKVNEYDNHLKITEKLKEEFLNDPFPNYYEEEIIENSLEIKKKQQLLLLDYLGIIDYLNKEYELNKTKFAKLIGYITDKTPERSLLTYLDKNMTPPDKKRDCRTKENYNQIIKILEDVGLNDLSLEVLKDKNKLE